jgi:rod shape-determining protein MreC
VERTRVKSKVWIFLLVVSVGAFLFFRHGVTAFASETTYPFSNAYQWFDQKIGLSFRAALTRVDYAARCAKQERELARLQVMFAEAETRETEIKHLRTLLGYTPPVMCRRIEVAPVLSRGGTTAIWQTLRIGKGSAHGLRKGDLVMVPEGVVGRISDVTLHTSDVMLITDPNSRVACELDLASEEGTGAIRGILYGGGVRPGGDPKLTLLYVVEPLRLRYMAREFEPAPRTRVVTSGLGNTFPKGLTVGYILSSTIEPQGLSREAEIIPAVDMASLYDVFVLLIREDKHAP